MSDVFDGDEVERDKISKQLKVVTVRKLSELRHTFTFGYKTDP